MTEQQQRQQMEMIQRMRNGGVNNPLSGGGGGAGGGGFQPLPVSAPPSEESISMLTSMGFNRQDAVNALMRSDNNVAVAANNLLSRG